MNLGSLQNNNMKGQFLTKREIRYCTDDECVGSWHVFPPVEMRGKLLGHLMMSNPADSLTSVGQASSRWGLQQQFFLVYQLGIWLKIPKVKIFLEPSYSFYGFFFFFLRVNFWAATIYLFQFLGELGKAGFLKGFQSTFVWSVLLLCTPSSTQFLIFISEL